MEGKKESTLDMPNALGNLTKMLEQFKLPGVDAAEILEARRKDIDAVVQANQAVYAGMRALADKQAEMLKQAMQDIQTAMKASAGGISVSDPGKQGELARKAYEKVLNDMKELAMIARKSQADAMASITQRGAQHLEEFKKMMKPK
jgi:phasin family protein